jgi:transcriptional regulator with XRE-family HTH domain
MRKAPWIELLANERRSAKMSVTELSERVGRCRSAMEKYEYGGRVPNFAVLTKWADVFGYEVKLEKKDGG